jgi:hypothetical protein
MALPDSTPRPLRHTTHPVRRAMVRAATEALVEQAGFARPAAESYAQLTVDRLLWHGELPPELVAIAADADVRRALDADARETTEAAATRVMAELTEARQQIEDHVALEADRWKSELLADVQAADTSGVIEEVYPPGTERPAPTSDETGRSYEDDGTVVVWRTAPAAETASTTKGT